MVGKYGILPDMGSWEYRAKFKSLRVRMITAAHDGERQAAEVVVELIPKPSYAMTTAAETAIVCTDRLCCSADLRGSPWASLARGQVLAQQCVGGAREQRSCMASDPERS